MTIVQNRSDNQSLAIEPFAPENKRVIQRRCPVCDRGHSCFATPSDLEPVVTENSEDVSVGSIHRLEQDIWGSWRGTKTRIPDGTKVIVKNLRTEPTGGLRAMVELPDGDTQWINAALLGQTIS